MSDSAASQRARIGGLTRAAKYNGVEVTENARKAFRDSFLKQVPTDLPEAERQRRAEALRRAHYARLAYRSAQARKRRKAASPEVERQRRADAQRRADEAREAYRAAQESGHEKAAASSDYAAAREAIGGSSTDLPPAA